MTTATVQDQPHELTWGALALDSEVAADTPWVCETMAESATFGNPVPLVEEVRSLLTDGSLAVISGWDNREMSFRVRLKAADGKALAQAEAAFMAEVLAKRPSPMVWTPPMLDAWPMVCDVVHARFDRDYADGWDFDERFRKFRYYTLTLTCLPWARDPETTTIEALPVPEDPNLPATYSVIDTCDATTGWSTKPEPLSAWSTISMGLQPGYVRGQATCSGGSAAPVAMAVTRTGAVDMLGDPYLTVDVDVSWIDSTGIVPDRLTVVFGGTSTAVAPVAMKAVANGTRFYFEAPASFSTVKIRQHFTRRSTATVAVMRVYEVGRSDRIEVDGSNGFQIARTAVVGGSAPTQAALRLDATPDPLLGSTALIYTGQSAAIPMRNHRHSSDTVTTDPSKISGGTNSLAAPMVFRVPVSQLQHATYSLLARLSSAGQVTVSWSAKVVSSAGAATPGSELVASGTTLVKNPTGDPWKIHHLADIQLPVVAIEGSTAHVVELSLSMASGGASVLVDEAWLLDTEHGAVTVIHEPTAFQLTSIELRSPELESPRPAVIGTWDTYGTQDITRLVTSFGTHLFEPGLLHVFTATDLAKYAQCELEYYRRYHSHPGPALEEEAA